MRFYSALLFAFAFSILIVFSIGLTPSYAQTINGNQSQSSYNTPDTNSNVPVNLHTYTQSAIIEIISSLSCQITGIDPTNPNQQCLGVNTKSGKIGYVQGQQSGGAIGFMTEMIQNTYTPPLHTKDYLQYMSSNFGITKSAYAAAASGFDSLKPLQAVWIAFRNIVYLIFVLVFVLIGLGIMLRYQIEAKTVMTIQNQIPKIIVGLLLITFSYAIAGFLIDTMYISMYVIYGTLSQSHIANVDVSRYDPAYMQGKVPMEAAGSLFNLNGQDQGVNGIANSGALQASGVIKKTLGIDDCVVACIDLSFITISATPPFVNFHPDNFTKLISLNRPFASWLIDLISAGAGFRAFTQTQQIAANIFPGVGAVGTIPALGLGTAVALAFEGLLRQGIPWLIPYLIIFIAIFVSLFRLWFALIKAYVFILVDVVLAPFWIMFGILPGSTITFGSWLRDMIANLSVFPVTLLMFLLGKVFVDIFTHQQSGTNVFIPPFIGNSDPNAIGALIGLGVILMTPTVVDMMREVFKAPNFKYTATIGQGISAGTGFFGSMAGGAIGRAVAVGPDGRAKGFAAQWFQEQGTGNRFSNGLVGKAGRFLLGIHHGTTPPEANSSSGSGTPPPPAGGTGRP